MNDYAISCDAEASLALSNKHSLELWQSLEKLIGILVDSSHFSTFAELYEWKQPHHLAKAKEPYSWRAALEEIKNSDISVKCANVSGELRVLMTDKPAMLKIAGEITNSLLHSYTSRHKLTFGQCISKVPS